MIIKHDNYIEAKLSIESQLPSTLDLVQRFSARYSKDLQKHLRPLLQSCAEETEHILSELLTSSAPGISVVKINTVRSQNKNKKLRTTGYRCPRCYGFDLRYGFKHCPHCAVEIKWT